MRYHLMGIGGIGVSALSRMLRAKGHEVSGCDKNPNALAQLLQEEGITVFSGESPEHVQNTDCLVVSTAIPHSHPEIMAAKAQNIPVKRRIEVLGEMMQTSPSVGIVGTHGKTTTTALVCSALLGAGEDISALVGSIVPELGHSNARLGSGHLVAEIDESDPYFQHVPSNILVLTNIEDDHISPDGKAHNNYHASYDELLQAFKHHISLAKTLLYCHDWQGLSEFTQSHPQRYSYGLNPEATYSAHNVKAHDSGVSFDLMYQNQALCPVSLPLLGDHNIQNALAALAVTHLVGRDVEQAAQALSQFQGAARRWQTIGTVQGAVVIDDYAHNPSKVQAALQAGRQTGRRVRVIFQPHRHLRTAQSWQRYAEILQAADQVIVLDIYGAGEAEIAGVHSKVIVEKMHASGYHNAHYAPNHDAAISLVMQDVEANDLIITMGAGDVTQIAPRLLEQA